MVVNSLLFGVLWYQIIAHVGISAGLHRYWAHRAFVAGTLFEILTLYMSVIAGSRSPIGWISAHRMHHHHSDTELDPHSPNTKGFWKVFFSLWTKPSIPPKYSRDLFSNPRMLFFHKHWFKIWLTSAIVCFLISPYVLLSFIIIPAVLSTIGFGLVNALTHNGSQVQNVPWINLLVAGEGYHKEHHNGLSLRYHKYDFTGAVLEFMIYIGVVRSNGKR